MASPPASSSSSSSDDDLEISSILSEIAMALEEGDIFICARPKRTNQRLLSPKKTNQRLLHVSKPCSTASEESTAKDGKQNSPSPGDERPNKNSHERILQMNTGAVPPPRTSSAFILDSAATSHVVGDVSLFSPSFRSRTTPTTPAGSAPAAAYQADDGKVLSVAGVGTVSCDSFRIPNVRCVPDLCTTGLNLVSVQELSVCGYLVVFGSGECSVMEQSSGKIVGKGQLHTDDGLYHLEFLNILHDDKACEDRTPT